MGINENDGEQLGVMEKIPPSCRRRGYSEIYRSLTWKCLVLSLVAWPSHRQIASYKKLTVPL